MDCLGGHGTSVDVILHGFDTNDIHGMHQQSGNTIGDIGKPDEVFQYKLQIDYQSANTDGDEARLRDWWFDSEMASSISTTHIRSLNGTCEYRMCMVNGMWKKPLKNAPPSWWQWLITMTVRFHSRRNDQIDLG